MEKLQLEDFLVVKKKSRLEVDAIKMGIDWRNVLEPDIFETMRKKYQYCKGFAERNLAAHQELCESVDALKKAGLTDIIEIEEMSLQKLAGKKAVIADGGDNHLIWVLDRLYSFLCDSPVIAMNATPSHSRGGILSDSKNTIAATIAACKEGNYRIERWPKIEGEILFHGKRTRLFPAAAEYVLGEYAGTQMSHWAIKNEMQRGNRLIVCNGVGSSGWYSNIHSILFDERDHFERDKRELRYIAEPADKAADYENLFGRVTDGEVLEVISYNDDRGVAVTDSNNRLEYIHEFPFGAVARLWVSEKVSKIIRC
jgi:hypothetical protein